MKVEQFIIAHDLVFLATECDIEIIRCPATGKLGCAGMNASGVCPKFFELDRKKNINKLCIVQETSLGGAKQAFDTANITNNNRYFLSSKIGSMKRTAGDAETHREEYDATFAKWEKLYSNELQKGY